MHFIVQTLNVMLTHRDNYDWLKVQNYRNVEIATQYLKFSYYTIDTTFIIVFIAIILQI